MNAAWRCGKPVANDLRSQWSRCWPARPIDRLINYGMICGSQYWINSVNMRFRATRYARQAFSRDPVEPSLEPSGAATSRFRPHFNYTLKTTHFFPRYTILVPRTSITLYIIRWIARASASRARSASRFNFNQFISPGNYRPTRWYLAPAGFTRLAGYCIILIARRDDTNSRRRVNVHATNI